MKNTFLFTIMLFALMAITSVSCSPPELEVELAETNGTETSSTPPSENTGDEDELTPN